MEENSNISSKRSIFEGASPKLTYWFGFVSGAASVSVLAWIIFGFGSASFSLGLSNFGNGGNNNTNTAKPTAFTKCLDNGDLASKVTADLNEGSQLGVNGTPATFINGKLVEGAVPYDQLKAVVEQALNNTIPQAEKVDVQLKDSDYIRGDKNAPVTMIEYSDLECPFCKSIHPSLVRIMNEYPGKVKWVYRHFPLSFHANAQKEAEAAECIGKLAGADKYWEFIDKVFERTTSNGTGFALTALPTLAGELGIK